MAVNALISLALYKPLGVQGVVFGSVAGTLVMASSQAWLLRRDLHGIEGAKTLAALLRMLLATALLAGVSYGLWYGLDQALGRTIPAQIVSLGVGILGGFAVYAGAVMALRIDEARQIRDLVMSRVRRS
jgi:putative peptidoglycan lipid II flippase